MKKIAWVAAVMVLALGADIMVSAQMMGGRGGAAISPPSAEDDGHTAREVEEGKGVWNRLEAKQVSCDGLTDDDFEALGEYYMDQMMGRAHHLSMNAMMERMLGEEGEHAAHEALGKRMSGCETDAAYPAGTIGFMPMMPIARSGYGDSLWGERAGMMGGGMGRGGLWGPHAGNSRWGYGGGAHGLAWTVLVWLGVVVAAVWAVRWIKRGGHEPSALSILKSRYVKGEISTEEYEERKKELQ